MNRKVFCVENCALENVSQFKYWSKIDTAETAIIVKANYETTLKFISFHFKKIAA